MHVKIPTISQTKKQRRDKYTLLSKHFKNHLQYYFKTNNIRDDLLDIPQKSIEF